MAKDRLKYFTDKDPWMLAEDIPDMDFFFSQIWLSCFVNEFKHPAGRAYKKILAIYKGYHLWFYFGEKDSYLEGEHIVNKFIKNPQFTREINKQIIVEADKLRTFAERVPEDNLEKLTNKKLWELYKKHFDAHKHYYQWCWIPVGVDMFHNNLTEKLKRHLRSLNVDENKVNEYLVILTQPTSKSLIQLEQDQFLEIASLIYKNKEQAQLLKNYFRLIKRQATLKYELNVHTPKYEKFLEDKIKNIVDKIDKKILIRLQNHYQNYFYVKFMWIGKEGLNSFQYYLKELARFVASGVNPNKEIKKQAHEFKKNLRKRMALIKKLGIKDPWLTIIGAWGDFMVTKIYRRYTQIYAIYRMKPVLEEIGRRLKLNLMEARFMTLDEIKKGLLNKRVDYKNLKTRVNFFAYYLEKDQEKIFVGEKAKRLANKVIRTNLNEVAELKGQTGCIGRATGKVKIIIRPKDMAKMQKGDILVSIATDPDIVPAMKKAAAIVTEQGGVTSHAAIVSREMNIPCVIGTKIATKVLKDGDLVEVDANKGVVKLLKRNK